MAGRDQPVIRCNLSPQEAAARLVRRTQKLDIGAYSDQRDLVFSRQKRKKVKLLLSADRKGRRGCSATFYATLRAEDGGTLLEGSFDVPLPFRLFPLLPLAFPPALFFLGEISGSIMLFFCLPCLLWLLLGLLLRRFSLNLTAPRSQELLRRVETLLND